MTERGSISEERARELFMIKLRENDHAWLMVDDPTRKSAISAIQQAVSECYGGGEAPPSQGKVERATSDPIAEVLVGLSRAFEAEYASMTEADVRELWYFQFDPAATLTNNLYTFHGALTLYARSCRKWEETHNGSMCVVERVRDKYLIPKITEFAATITQALTESSEQGTDGACCEAMREAAARCMETYATRNSENIPRAKAIRALPLPVSADGGDAVIDGDMRIGAVIFRKGVKVSTVLDCAKRAFQHNPVGGIEKSLVDGDECFAVLKSKQPSDTGAEK